MKRLMGIFLALFMVMGMFSSPALAAVSDDDLNTYLKEVSSERGWETLTKEEFNEYLKTVSYLEGGIGEFDTVEEMKEYLGEVISADLSNVDRINEDYKTDVVTLLEENDDSMDHYLYVDDLEFAVMDYLGTGPDDEEMFDEDFLSFLADTFGLTEEEIDRLIAHLDSLESELSKPENEKKLEDIGLQMMEFQNFESAADLTDEQVAELLHLSKELMNLLHLDAKFYLVDNNNKKTTISYKELLFVEEENLKGFNLLIELYSTDTDDFLADFLITSDMFNSDIIKDTGKEIEQTPTVTTPKTVKGAKLPKTSGSYMDFTILGISMLFIGLFLARRIKRA